MIASTIDPERQASARSLKAAVAENKDKNFKLRTFRGKNGALETAEAKSLMDDAQASAQN